MQLFAPLIIGIVLLLAGRRLFWLFVGCVGFLAGATYVPQFLPVQDPQTVIILSIGAGIAGALLAIFVKKFAIGMAGFLGGAYFAASIFHVWDVTGIPQSIVIIAAGVLGAIAMYAIFDLALIILSSVTGATMITTYFSFNEQISTAVFFFLVLFGILSQSKLFRAREKNT